MNSRSKYLKENLTLANFLSAIRMVLIVPFVLFFKKQDYFFAASMLVLSGISDFFDGIAARALNQITALGKILDPIADKMTLITVLICICTMFPSVVYFAVILIIKDLLMLIGGAVLIKKRITPPASKWYGKVGTALFYFSVTLLVVMKIIFKYEAGTILLISLFSATTAMMIFAVVKYFIMFKSLIKESKTTVNDRTEKKGE